MSEFQTKTAHGTCIDCGNGFTYERIFSFDEDVCDLCQKIRDQKEEEEREIRAKKYREETAQREREQIQRRWENLVPDRFIDTSLDHPQFKRTLHDKVQKWEPSRDKPWLGLIGEKGCCKTRIACLRLKKAMEIGEGISPSDYESNPYNGEQGNRYPMILTSYDFSRSVVGQYSDDKSEAKDSKKTLKNARHSAYLIFDDVGKAKATPAVISALFGLLDHRYSNNLRTIWTANSTPEEFCEGMPEDVAGPLVRRLKEASTLFAIA